MNLAYADLTDKEVSGVPCAALVPDSMLLPIEAINRELDGRILLGLVAAERGIRPFIGWKLRIDAAGFPPSFYVSKSVKLGNSFGMLRGFGHTIIGLDEEGLVRLPHELYSLKIEERALTTPRALLSWGRSNSDLWRRNRYYDGTPIIETGNPRVDMLRPELRAFHQRDVDGLRSKYGRFVLINTNFGTVNNIYSAKQIRVASTAPKEDVDRFRQGVRDHKSRLFTHFLELAPLLARSIAPRKLVIRPHHSENAAPWQ